MKRFWSIAQLIVGTLIGYALFFYFSNSYSNFDPKDFALGPSNHTKKATTKDFLRFHGDVAAIKSLAENMNKEKAVGNKIILIFGASQLHAINDYKEGDSLSVEYINDYFIKYNKAWRMYQFSFPNASYCDYLAFYLNFRQNHAPIDLLVLDLQYKSNLGWDLYEGNLKGLKKEFVASKLKNNPGIIALVAAINKYESSNTFSSEDKKPLERTIVSGTPQELLEKLINKTLDSIVPNFVYRKTLMAKLNAERIDFLHNFNIYTFKDVPLEAPPLAKEIVSRNLIAYESLIDLANSEDVPIIMYRQPIKPTFYNNSPEYESYYDGLKNSVAASNNIFYTDYSRIVPIQYYGILLGNVDFIHFKNEGHKIVGYRLATLIDSLENVEYFK